jgi:hypothetical protein
MALSFDPVATWLVTWLVKRRSGGAAVCPRYGLFRIRVNKRLINRPNGPFDALLQGLRRNAALFQIAVVALS